MVAKVNLGARYSCRLQCACTTFHNVDPYTPTSTHSMANMLLPSSLVYTKKKLQPYALHFNDVISYVSCFSYEYFTFGKILFFSRFSTLLSAIASVCMCVCFHTSTWTQQHHITALHLSTYTWNNVCASYKFIYFVYARNNIEEPT